MGTVFFTGFPGFLGGELLPRILSGGPQVRAACLVQPKFAAMARVRAAELAAAHPATDGRIEIVEGDVTEPGLGPAADAALRARVAEIYHLAAVYDLSVGPDLAMRVNVDGTRRMLDFAADCPGLERFHYVSTCYVSGTHPGVFSEEHLELGQRFHNYYEETKFLAEVEVQKRMRGGLPATIYRPAVIVGDSATGSTQKYDGPYSVIRLMLRQRGAAFVPVIGDPRRAEVNVVPRDFVVNAMTWLAAREDSRGAVYHLADPHPLTVAEMIDALGSATERKVIRIPVPLSLAKMSLDRVPGLARLVGIPAAALDYFVHPAHYAAERTQAALAGSGIRCPRFTDYAGRLVRFVRMHPEIGSAAMA